MKGVIFMKININENKLSLMVGDITKQATDFIVNAANGSLLGGGGVDGAIHRAAGPELLKMNKRVRQDLLAGDELPTGEAVVTKGFKLPAKHVIHTVGPIWENRGDEAKLLKNCYENSLKLAYMYDSHMEATIAEKGGQLSRDISLTKKPQLNEHKVSISFPSISTGVYRFPLEEAAQIALGTIYGFLNKYAFGEVSMILFSEDDYTVYETVLRSLDE